mmetsp:Transcript_25105/g.71565  ORF Transcript_25105/g.71565 Transcript_25105/m.71565 type:complete len:230 (+) Transcript_25105:176-865(+)
MLSRAQASPSEPLASARPACTSWQWASRPKSATWPPWRKRCSSPQEERRSPSPGSSSRSPPASQPGSTSTKARVARWWRPRSPSPSLPSTGMLLALRRMVRRKATPRRAVEQRRRKMASCPTVTLTCQRTGEYAPQRGAATTPRSGTFGSTKELPVTYSRSFSSPSLPRHPSSHTFGKAPSARPRHTSARVSAYSCGFSAVSTCLPVCSCSSLHILKATGHCDWKSPCI